MSLSYDFGLGTNNNGDVYGFTNNRDTTRSETFTYDQLNRVTSGQTTSTQWGTNYTFDIWGNLLQKTPMTGKTSGENLVQAVDGNNRLTGCGYDAAGNQTNDCLGNTITYDQENRVLTTQGVTYAYDGDGVRVEKSSGRLYWGALTESDLSGNNTADYVFFGSERVARVDLPSGTVHYFFEDHLTSVGVVTNATGTVIEQEIDHRPFGEESIIANTITDQHFRFMNKERDVETGYDFFGARYYNSMSGRWLSPDWSSSPSAVPYATLANPQTLNLYAFVQNNPATNIELDGHVYVLVRHGEWHYANCISCETGLREDAGNPDDMETISPEQPDPRLPVAPAPTTLSGNGQQSNQTGAADSQAQQEPDQRAIDRTAMAAEKQALKLTRAALKAGHHVEYGGWILRSQKDGSLTYTKPVSGGEGEVNVDKIPVPKGFTKVAEYHTHPHTTHAEGEGPSVRDINRLRSVARNEHVDRTGYVSDTFSGVMYRYTQWEPIKNAYDTGVYGTPIGTIPP